MYRSLLVLLLGLLVSAPAVAAEAEKSVVDMGEVVVTATRQEEAITKVPANVTVITEDEIRQSPALTVPDLLRGVAGVLVNDVNGNGRHYNVDLRGFGETAALNTLVLVDGRRINQADLSGTDWSLIPKDRVERIEIVRGGRGSVLYGDNASGGVINIITRKGRVDLNGEVGLLAGSHETFQGDAAVGGALKNLSFAINGNYRDSEGYRDNSETLAKDVGMNLGYDATDRLSFYLNGGYHEDETGMPGGLYKSQLNSGVSRRATFNPDDYSDTTDWYVQGGARLYLTGDSYMELDLSDREREAEFFFSSVWGDYTGTTELETRSVSPVLVVNEDILGYATNILVGFDYEKAEEDILNDASGFVSSFDMSKESNGYFVHADIALTEQLNLSGGYRREEADFDFEWIEGGTTDSATVEEDLYTLGVNYAFQENSSVYLSYSKSFRSPVIDEFFNFYTNTVNSSLQAQTSDDFEVGARLELASGLALGVNLFRIETEDEIFLNPATYANENLDGDTIRQGFEFSVSKEVCTVLLNGSYTFRDAEVDGGQYDGKELPNVPEHQFTVGAKKMFGDRIQLVLNGVYVGERRFISDFDNSLGYQDDYFNLSGKLSYLLDNGSIYITANNVLDQEYEEYGLDYGAEYLYPSPRATFAVGARVNF